MASSQDLTLRKISDDNENINDEVTEQSSMTRKKWPRITKTAKFFKKNADNTFECLLCPVGRLLKKDIDGGTNSRWRHLKKFHPREHATISPQSRKQRILDNMRPRRSNMPLNSKMASSQELALHKVSDDHENINDEATEQSSTTREKWPRMTKTAKFFKKNADNKFECLLCPAGRLLEKDINSGTNSRWRHLKKFHPQEYVTISPQSRKQRILDNILPIQSNMPVQLSGINPERTHEELVRFIVRTDCPFGLVDGAALKRLLTYFAQAEVKIPSSKTIHDYAITMFDNRKAKLRRMLKSSRKVALTISGWTSTNQIPLLGVTIHWISDDWILCERVLGLEEIDGPHSGENMGEIVFNILKDFGVVNKLTAITTENAKNNLSMLSYLGQSINIDGSILFDAKNHMPCVAHMFNFIVQVGIKELGIEAGQSEDEILRKIIEGESMVHPPSTVLGGLVRRLRRTIIAIKMAPQRIARYKALCEVYKLPDSEDLTVDCSTKWNSTLDMISRALLKREVIDQISKDMLTTAKDNYTITTEEWTLLDEFGQMLVPFGEAIDMLGNAKSVSISSVLRIMKGVLTLLDSDMASIEEKENILNSSSTSVQVASLRRAYHAMTSELEKCISVVRSNPVYMIATVLDPVMKLSQISPTEHSILRERLQMFLEAREDAQQSIMALEARPPPPVASTTTSFRTISKQHNRLSSHLNSPIECVDPTKKTVADEVNEYLGDSCAIGAEPLTWWKEIGRTRYPRLAELAKDFICVCATSASSERLFSSGTEIIAYKRASLASETISMLATMKCWAREDDSVEGLIEDW